MFSGLYKLTSITSSFKAGKFTQTLQGYRRPGQEITDSKSKDNLLSSQVEKQKPAEAAG